MNTASRMESTGVPNKIQVSQATADALIAAGKESWVSPREEKVIAKGKGELQTYWLTIMAGSESGSVTGSNSTSNMKHDEEELENSLSTSDETTSTKSASAKPKRILCEKSKRLVKWNVDILAKLLKKVIAQRNAREKKEKKKAAMNFDLTTSGGNFFDEVQDTLSLPQFDTKLHQSQIAPESIELKKPVESQLYAFVSEIALLYHDENPFHNFEHAR
jgi:hypothetical protein